MSADDSNPEDSIRDAVDRARSGAPAAGEAVRDRFSTDEIFQRVIASADEEIDSSVRELFFSGLAAGFAITLTVLAHAELSATFSNPQIGALLYPVGFIYIIMGRYQLYTENTLPPVTLVLTRLASIPLLFRVWGVVLFGNLLGAALGALVLAHANVLTPEAAHAAVEFGREGIRHGWWSLFFKAIFAGWLVAGMVWLDHASRDSATRLLLVYVIIYTIPATGLYHVVVTACDASYLVFTGHAGLIPVVVHFWTPVLLGNTLGGVFLVAVVNYAQTGERHFLSDYRETLSLREWVLGWHAGRPKVSLREDGGDSER